jgi:hypothetical protein
MRGTVTYDTPYVFFEIQDISQRWWDGVYLRRPRVAHLLRGLVNRQLLLLSFNHLVDDRQTQRRDHGDRELHQHAPLHSLEPENVQLRLGRVRYDGHRILAHSDRQLVV